MPQRVFPVPARSGLVMLASASVVVAAALNLALKSLNESRARSLKELAERKRRGSAGEPVNTQALAYSGDGGFPIPQSWRWARLGFVTNVLMGQSLQTVNECLSRLISVPRR